MGPLSRFEKKSTKKAYDLMVLLSGPEPQRTLLENRLTEELQAFSGQILMVRGVIEKEQTQEEITLDSGTMLKVNFMRSEELSQSVQASDFILCRSGYTTVMDLAKLGKKAFFIPTPGQYEQIHIAKRLDQLKVVPSCTQEEFSLDQLERISSYSGLEAFSSAVDFDELFSVF
jgi:predicted glycosyltransferase